MNEYIAKYVIEAGLFDAGTFMSDPEPHHKEYKFAALDDEEAKKKAEEHKREVSKDYFGVRSITLDHLSEIRELNLKKEVRKIKTVSFNEEMGLLVDEENKPYEGKRMRSVFISNNAHFSDVVAARNQALFNLESMALEAGADAYEVMNVVIEDSKQEYDSQPYSATVHAILYKS